MLDIGITHANWSRHTICLDDQAMQLRLVALNKSFYNMNNAALCFYIAKIYDWRNDSKMIQSKRKGFNDIR